MPKIKRNNNTITTTIDNTISSSIDNINSSLSRLDKKIKLNNKINRRNNWVRGRR